MPSAPVLLMDTETTSTGWFREVWNVGAILRVPGQPEVRRELIIDDVDVTYANPFSLSMGHFWERHPRVGGDPGDAEVVTSERAAEAVARWLRPVGGQRPHVVGTVPNFDTEVLETLLRRHNQAWGAHYHLLDVENVIVGFLLGSGFFTRWERFLGRLAPLLPGGVVSGAQRETLVAGRPIVDVEEAAWSSFPLYAEEWSLWATVAGVSSVEGVAVAPTPYLHPGPPWDSGVLGRAMGVAAPPPELRHTALGDAAWVAELYDRLLLAAPEAMQGWLAVAA